MNLKPRNPLKNKKPVEKKSLLTVAAGVAAMTLLLAGCGGGGAVRKADPGPQTVDLSGLAADVMTETGTLDLKAGVSGEIGEVTFTCATGGDDCAVTVTEKDGKAAASATGGMVTAAASADYARRKADEQKALTDKLTREAGTKQKAITAEADQETDADLGGTARNDADGTNTFDDTSDDVYRMEIERDRTGTTITITDPHMDADDDPKFAQQSELDNGRTMHTRTMSADDDGNVVMETVVVGTDIEGPRAVPFVRFESADGIQTQRLDRDLDNDTETNEALTVSEDNAALVMSAAFAHTSATTTQLIFPGDKTITGTYNGAAGKYRCMVDNGNCTITLNDEGAVTGVGNFGDWVFIPEKGATSDQPDYDYLHYGFWLKKMTDKDGVVTYEEVETFAGSSRDVSNGSDIDSVVGSATYRGRAAGVYVKNVYDTDGPMTSATAGHFTADARLTANFGGDSVAVNRHNTVTGTIDNFTLSGGEANIWSVALEGTRESGANTVSGTADGGGIQRKFSGTFHGPIDPYDHDDNEQTPDIYRIPHTLVGEFNADFVNGTVAGAFGTRQQTAQ